MALSLQGESGQQDQSLEVAMRMIGHRVLLVSGDSASRVLPIQREGETYRIAFATEFGFVPDDIVGISNEVLKEAGVDMGYILEVKECESQDVVYSFQVGDVSNPDIMPCRSRAVEKGCYTVDLTLLNPTWAMAQHQDDDAGSGFEKMTNPSILALLMLTLSFLVVAKQRQDIIPASEGVAVGQFTFNPRTSVLTLGQDNTELTGKEAELLMVLLGSANQTMEREAILKAVWGGESYIGRTLDVFVSKLRKRLARDPSIKIVNVRGVGYKLVV
jgi:hypothetical protein